MTATRAEDLRHSLAALLGHDPAHPRVEALRHRDGRYQLAIPADDAARLIDACRALGRLLAGRAGAPEL